MSIEFTKESVWQMEFSNSFPSVIVRFTVVAKTYEGAISENGMRMSACYRLKEVP